MHEILWVMAGTFIAACIGGMTNFLAIKMLFHPRTAVFLGNAKLPFTPGLIPKRKAEIARSLGKVVGDYLVTSRGLVSVLRQETFRKKWEEKLIRAVSERLDSERTVRETLVHYTGRQRGEQLERALKKWGRRQIRRGILWLWEVRGWKAKPLGVWFPVSEERKQKWSEQIALLLLREVREELNSFQGEHMLNRTITRFLSESGGWLGAIAGMVADPVKIAGKVRTVLLDVLDMPETKDRLQALLMKNMRRLEAKTPDELVRTMTGEPSRKWLLDRADSLFNPDIAVDGWMDRKVKDLANGYREQILALVPDFSGWVLDRAENRMEQLIRDLDLPALVEREVDRFPVERLEEIILKVSGKEFRAITWLGAVIGGLIGLVQSILFVYVA